MNIIITGSTGFIGRRLFKFLEKKGHSVTTIHRKETSEYKKTIICDLEQSSLKNGSLKGFDCLFHLAGYSKDVKDTRKNREKYIKLNFDSTIKLAKLADLDGVKNFFFISSVKASQNYSNNKFSKDNTKGLYGQIKRETEEELIKLSKDMDMNIFIIRPSVVYGPEVGGNLLNMKNAIKYGFFPPLPKINNSKSMIHVDDLVRAIYFLNQFGEPKKIYTITDGEVYSTTEIYETLHIILNKDIPKLKLPYFLINLLRLIPGPTKSIINKLFEDDLHSSNEILSIGFNPKLRFRNLEETLF